MHCIIHEALYPSKQAWGSGTVNSLFFLISLVDPNGKFDPQISRLIITRTVMSKIISTVGTGQKAKQKFVYNNKIHCLLSISNTHLNTSLTNSIEQPWSSVSLISIYASAVGSIRVSSLAEYLRHIVNASA